MPEPCLCLVAIAVSALPARCVPPQADGQLLPHQHREEGGVGCGGKGEGLLSWTGTPRLPVHQGISKGHSSSSVVFEDHQLELPKGGRLLPTGNCVSDGTSSRPSEGWGRTQPCCEGRRSLPRSEGGSRSGLSGRR